MTAAGVLAALSLGSVTPQAYAADQTGAELVPDGNYRACLATAAGAGPDALTVGDLNGITGKVDCNSEAIRSMAGTRYLTSVRILDLSHNQISTLPKGEFDTLDSLLELHLPVNHITKLDAKVFNGLKSLQVLRMYGNTISSLPPGVFDQLGSLRKLYLSTNQIETLPENVFDQLANLGYLDLEGNKISEFPDDVFAKLDKLTQLVLSKNGISVLRDDMFEGLTGLKGLHLTGNQIESLSAKVFKPLTKLTTLNLEGNRLLDMSGLSGMRGLVLRNQKRRVVVASGGRVSVVILNTNGVAPAGPTPGSNNTAVWDDGVVSWIGTDTTADTISFARDALGGEGKPTLTLTVVLGVTVDYDANGGTGTGPNAQLGEANAPVVVQPNSFTRAGFGFAGWNTDPDGGGDTYLPGDQLPLGQEDVKLYALWNPVQVAVSGTGTVGDQLTATLSGWLEDTPVDVQWVASDNPDGTGYTPIAGATAQVRTPDTATFVPDHSLIGRYVGATATVDGQPEVSGFVQIAGLPAGTVAVTGTGVAGQTLTATPQGWPTQTAFDYQWVTAPGTPIPGATGDTFTPTAELIGEQVGVVITPTDPDYGQIEVASPYLMIIAAPTPTPTATQTGGTGSGNLPLTGADAFATGLLALAGLAGLATGTVLLRTRRRT